MFITRSQYILLSVTICKTIEHQKKYTSSWCICVTFVPTYICWSKLNKCIKAILYFKLQLTLAKKFVISIDKKCKESPSRKMSSALAEFRLLRSGKWSLSSSLKRFRFNDFWNRVSFCSRVSTESGFMPASRHRTYRQRLHLRRLRNVT